MERTAIRVGLIGAGVMGAEHARLLTREVSGASVTGVFDTDPHRAAVTATAAGATVADDPMVLIKDDRVDAVLVASGDDSHAEFTLAAIAAGKPVLCEKPLAPDRASCRAIIAAEQDFGERLVTVGFMRRFDSGYRQLRDAIRGGDLGRPLVMHCVHRNRAAPPIDSATVISGSAVHELDIAGWLLDEDLTEITAHRPRRAAAAGDTQDPVLLIARSESDVLVDIEVFVNAGYGYEVGCEVVCERGTAGLAGPATPPIRAAGRVGRRLPDDWRPRFVDAYRAELQAWIDLLTERDNPGVVDLATAADGDRATARATAAIVASESGRTEPVEP